MGTNIPEMDDVKLNSYYYEVGERSYMKEALAYQVRCMSRMQYSSWVQAPTCTSYLAGLVN